MEKSKLIIGLGVAALWMVSTLPLSAETHVGVQGQQEKMVRAKKPVANQTGQRLADAYYAACGKKVEPSVAAAHETRVINAIHNCQNRPNSVKNQRVRDKVEAGEVKQVPVSRK